MPVARGQGGKERIVRKAGGGGGGDGRWPGIPSREDENGAILKTAEEKV